MLDKVLARSCLSRETGQMIALPSPLLYDLDIIYVRRVMRHCEYQQKHTSLRNYNVQFAFIHAFAKTELRICCANFTYLHVVTCVRA